MGNVSKLYNNIGLFLCGVAGGIVGFILGGPFCSALGAIVGVTGGHAFEKIVSPA